MDNFVLTIKVNDGNLFEGSLEQWEDCFFSFPFHYSMNDKLDQVQRYCSDSKYDLTLSWKAKNTDNNSQLLMTVE